MLAMTAKLGQMMTQMSWVPGDSSLVGLAQLSGEQQPDRLRDAVAAVFRVYLALATGGACVLLAVNGAFVRGWVGPHLFAGSGRERRARRDHPRRARSRTAWRWSHRRWASGCTSAWRRLHPAPSRSCSR